MTRLQTKDIAAISTDLSEYNTQLEEKTGSDLLAIASHACRVDEKRARTMLRKLFVHVVPITTGQGVISGFSGTVCAILKFLGVQAEVATASDASGIAQAYEKGKDGLFLADDHRFVGIIFKTLKVVDNSALTGAVYAAALDLMTGGLSDREVLVIGCGPVGKHAAARLVQSGANVFLYDLNIAAAKKIRDKLQHPNVRVIEELPRNGIFNNILEAAPAPDSIPDFLLSPTTRVAAAGVPLGMSSLGYQSINQKLIHDKLELGVAAMAVSLLNLNKDK